jgi:hypothetical protein
VEEFEGILSALIKTCHCSFTFDEEDMCLKEVRPTFAHRLAWRCSSATSFSATAATDSDNLAIPGVDVDLEHSCRRRRHLLRLGVLPPSNLERTSKP